MVGEVVSWGRYVFLGVTLAAVALFAWSVCRRLQMLYSVRRVHRFDRIPERFLGLLSRMFGEFKLFYDPIPGLAHALVFWGFCVVSVESVDFFLGAAGVSGGLPLAQGPFYAMYEGFSVLVILAVGYFLWRRLFVKKTRVVKSRAGLLVLAMILVLMVTGLVMSAGETVLAGHANSWKFVSNQFAPTLAGLSPSTTAWLYATHWWLHGLIFLAFLNYLPHSKHMHVLTVAFNIFFRDLEPKGRIRKLDLENSERFGLADYRDLNWKDVLDGFTCTECGRCTERCPAQNAGKQLDPKEVILNIRRYVYENFPAAAAGGREEVPPLIDRWIAKQDIVDCTSCHGCVTSCPVENEHLSKIIGMRQNFVLMEGSLPEGYELTFRNLENNANPWGLGSATRGDWADKLGLPHLADHPEAEYVYFMGCAACFDTRAQRAAKSFTALLGRAGVSFAVLGGEEFCCGDPARRMGNEYLFQEMLEANRSVIERYGLADKQLILTDPHCYNSLKNEYNDFGIVLDVTHHTTFIEHLLETGKLRPGRAAAGPITFHDSCYLGRYNGIYDAPRQTLARIGHQTREMQNNRRNSMCCGGGGGRMWLDEDADHRVNVARVKEAMAVGAEIMVTSCPYCLSMLEDGVLHLGAELQVRDIAEMVEQALEEDVNA